MELFKLIGKFTISPGTKTPPAEVSFKGVINNVTSIGKMLGAKAVAVAAVAAAIVAATVMVIKTIVSLTEKVGNHAKEIINAARVTGMTTDSIQRWQSATRVAGTSLDAVTTAAERLTRSMETMKSESNKGNKAMKELGYSFEQLESMDADQRMEALIMALAEVEDRTERAKLGTDLFGEAWGDLAPVVDLGTEALQDARKNARMFSEDDLELANSVRIQFDAIKEWAEHLALKFGYELLPTAEKMFDWIEGHMPEIERVIVFSFEAIGKYITTWATIINDYLIPTFEALERVVNSFKGVVTGPAEAIQSITEKIGGALENTDTTEEGDHKGYGLKISQNMAETVTKFIKPKLKPEENHSGQLTIEGVNDQGQVIGTKEIIFNNEGVYMN